VVTRQRVTPSIYIATFGRSASVRVGDLAVSRPPLAPEAAARMTPVQRTNMEVIYTEFAKRGLPIEIAQAAIANAHKESYIGIRNYGDKEVRDAYPDRPTGNPHAIGIFQIHDLHGKRFPPGPVNNWSGRLDPVWNTNWMLDNEVTAPAGVALRSAAGAGASIAELAAIFSRDIERPKDVERNMIERRERAVWLFGPSALRALRESSGTSSSEGSARRCRRAGRRYGRHRGRGHGGGPGGHLLVHEAIDACAEGSGSCG